jgi:hypothetical protein
MEHSLFISADAAARILDRPADSGILQLFIGDQVVLEGPFDIERKAFALLPKLGEIYRLAAMPSGDAAADRGNTSGVAEMILKRGGETIKVPVAQWWIEQRRIDHSRQCSEDWDQPISAPLISPFSNQTVSVTASGDLYEGSPIMRVFLDDELIGEAPVVASHGRGESQVFTFVRNGHRAPQSLRIAFANDHSSAEAGKDRNLWITDIRINGRPLALDDGTYERDDGEQAAAGNGMFWAGSLKFTLPVQVIQAVGGAGASLPAQ